MTWSRAFCTIRSLRVGTPSGRFSLLPALCIQTRLMSAVGTDLLAFLALASLSFVLFVLLFFFLFDGLLLLFRL